MAQGDRSGDEGRGPKFTGTVGKLTLLNISVSLLGILSGVVQARALGPDGRGELAAIIVPLYFVGFLGDLGLGLYARREAARTTALGELIATMSVTVGAIGAVLALALVPFVDVVARGRSAVDLWLSIGLLLLPVSLVGNVLLSIALGLERWVLWIRARLLMAVGWLVVLGVIYGSGELTVSTAACSYLIITLASYAPLLSVLRHAGPMRFRRALARDAIPFGSRAWLASLTNLANTRLDQLLMAGVVSSRQLGLYVVAVTLAAFPSNFSGAVALGILPRVVREGEDVVPRAVRVSLAIVVLASIVIAALAWPVVHFAIGRPFAPALPMIWVLLVAEIPLAGTVTLGQAFIGSGRPGQTAWAEGMALFVTVLGLAVVLPRLGGFGAALVSLGAYSVAFAYLLVQSRRTFGHRFVSLVLPTKSDVAWAGDELRRLFGGVRGRRRSGWLASPSAGTGRDPP